MALSIATWKFALADRELVTKAFLSKPGVAAYTRRRSGYNELRVEIEDPEDVAALEAAAYTSVLRAWRNGVNRFNGVLVEPEETGSSFSIVAKDPYYNHAWRRVRAQVTYDGVADGQIAWNLLELQEGYEPTGLRQGPADTTETRADPRTFEPGDRVDEKTDYLTRLPDGFAFTIDAVDGVPGILAEFSVHRPAGVTRAAARFEYGAGTRGTIEDYSRRALQLVNRSTVIGTSPEGAPIFQTAESATSPALHGLWEDERGHVTTSDETALEDIAAEGKSDEIPYELSIAPGPTAPQLFTDFDVGDSVFVLIRRRGTTIVNANLPVELATVLLDPESGVELLDELVVNEAVA